MGPAAIDVVPVVIRPNAMSSLWIVEAHDWHTVAHRDTVCARIRAKIGIEGSIFLHNDDDVLDAATVGGRTAGWSCHYESASDHQTPAQ